MASQAQEDEASGEECAEAGACEPDISLADIAEQLRDLAGVLADLSKRPLEQEPRASR